MMLGFLKIDLVERVLHTHRDSYFLDNVTVISVRRPFLAMGLMGGVGLIGFGITFGDLMYPHEIATASLIGCVMLIVGCGLGQLRLLSRDLRGSELADAVWGSYGSLNRKRLEIAQAIRRPATRAE